MCGIAGAVSTANDSALVRRRVERMQKCLRHRGPDDQGVKSFTDPACALAHTRLAIIDLSENGHQPMACAEGRYWITFNGEIYNYRGLREQLEQDGEVFRSESDTEVILALYRRHGARCLRKLRGMFAFFIWDDVDKRGFAARDPFGIKPLYYWHDDDTLAFASELRALRAAAFSKFRLSSRGVATYLLRGTVSEPFTLLRNYRQLKAGHYMTWEDNQVKRARYVQTSFKSADISYDDAVQVTRKALIESVKAHMVSDVPVGIFLSGGLDSTALLALACQHSQQPINTYSIAFEDPKWNEGDAASKIARHFRTNHTEWLLTPADAQRLYADFVEAIDQPTIDGFNTFCVSRLAAHHGQKVVLSGLGGDELFGGYKSFQLLPVMVRLSAALGPLAGVIRWLAASCNQLVGFRGRRIFDFLLRPGSLSAAQRSLRGVFSLKETNEILQALSLQPFHRYPQEYEGQTIGDQISATELNSYLRNQLLRDSDVMSMAWALELRVPLVDYRLWKTLAKIPAQYRLQKGKKLLVDSVPEIPHWVSQQAKRGFRFPFDEWFRNEWQSLPIPYQLPSWLKLRPWYRRWSLAVLAEWRRQHL